ncbi:MAG: cupredoxin domain-containing protein [Chloroflexi bacterium OHK40]
MLQFARPLAAMFLAVALAACTTPRADVTITSEGCSTSELFLAKTREPVLRVANRASAPMVLTVPTMNEWISVPPGAEAEFELPRYIMGRFDFFCLGEAEHTELSGGNPFLCALEPAEVAPVALSGGVLEIEQHDRIREIQGATAPAP